ncbi:MAG: hypothetical protein ABI459_07080, partial [Deltaproteobacteria bacterium]
CSHPPDGGRMMGPKFVVILTAFAFAFCGPVFGEEISSSLAAQSLSMCQSYEPYASKLGALKALGWENLKTEEEFSEADHAFADGEVAVNGGGNWPHSKEYLTKLLKYNNSAKHKAEKHGELDGWFKVGGARPMGYMVITEPSMMTDGKITVLTGVTSCVIAFATFTDLSAQSLGIQEWDRDRASKIGTFYLNKHKDEPDGGSLLGAQIIPIKYRKQAGTWPTIASYLTFRPNLDRLFQTPQTNTGNSEKVSP